MNKSFLLQFRLSVLVGLIFLVSCAHKNYEPKVIQIEKPIVLKFEVPPGYEEVTLYKSRTLISSYKDGKLVNTEKDNVDFDIKFESHFLDSKKNVHGLVYVLRKMGKVDLQDLAFPDKGELLEVMYSPKAEVLKAGDYPITSVFYVPPLSLPDNPVQIGDTWELKRDWVNLKTPIPMRMKLVSILKNIYSCGQGGQCADIEVSGTVEILGLQTDKLQFDSEIQGRFLYSIDKSTILWSMVKSDESLISPKSKVRVQSCLMSNLDEPEELIWPGSRNQSDCDPASSEPVKLP